MKTAVTVLQELMIKLGNLPEYECISQSGPQHQAIFEYRCTARGVSVTGQARSKKEAKQEAARRMLAQLHARGLSVPLPYTAPPSPPPDAPPSPTGDPALEAGGRSAAGAAGGSRSYVTLLKELCEEYRLGEAQYELVSDTGPAHQRLFTMRAALRQHERHATATTKKAARQLAAETLYTYLRENLVRLTKDFVEEEALARAHERRAAEKRNEAALQRFEALGEQAWRPDLGQRLADYHLGLLTHIDEDHRTTGLAALDALRASEDSEKDLEKVCGALGLRVQAAELPGVAALCIEPTAPRIAFAGATMAEAAGSALRYLRKALDLPRDFGKTA